MPESVIALAWHSQKLKVTLADAGQFNYLRLDVVSGSELLAFRSDA